MQQVKNQRYNFSELFCVISKTETTKMNLDRMRCVGTLWCYGVSLNQLRTSFCLLIEYAVYIFLKTEEEDFDMKL